MQFVIKASAIVLASVLTATTAVISSAEATPTSTSEQIIAQAEQQSTCSRRQLCRTRRQPLRSTHPTQSNQQSLSTYNQAFLAGLGVAYACGYSRGTNTSACATLNSSISMLSDGCAKGDGNSCQWVRKLYDLEHAGKISSEIRFF